MMQAMTKERMDTAYHSPRGALWASRILRGLVGLVLLTTALGKSLDLMGFAQVVGTYQVFPEVLWLPVALAMTVTEWVLAFWLFSGRRPVRASLAAAGLHLVFTGWAAMTVLRGIEVPNCGCFGVFLARPLTWGTVVEDAVMLTVCLLAMWASVAAVRGRSERARGLRT
jgi:hypothetical protein